MPSLDAFQLRKKIPQEEFDYTLLSSILSDYIGPRQKIHDLIKKEVITRVKKGLYVFGPDYNQVPVCKEVLANLIYGPSYISLEYALSFHGLIPERVEKMTSVTSKKDKKFSTPMGEFTYRHLTLQKYAIGIEQIWIDRTHPVLIASIEKALSDILILNKIPTFKTEKEAKIFLEDDLRIDQEHWKRFDLKTLRQLNKVYRSKNIDQILEVLESER